MTDKVDENAFFKEVVGTNTIEIKKPEKIEDNWYTKKSQSLSISKEDYILAEFKEKYKNLVVKDWAQFLNLVNVNNKIKKWYSNQSVIFTTKIQMPIIFKDSIPLAEYNNLQTDLNDYKKEMEEEIFLMDSAKARYDEEIRTIRKTYSESTKKRFIENKYLRILRINITNLPASLSLIILNYSPKTADSPLKQKIYSKEILVRYQMALVEIVNKDPDVDLDTIISSLEEK